MAVSEYKKNPVSDWKKVTKDILSKYPLKEDEILEIAILSWQRLWSSQIGGQIKIDEVNLPATVIGYFFQKLFAHELAKRYPLIWKGELLKSDKDLVNMQDAQFSTEMKASGQLGYALFGNRSYNQKTGSAGNAGKDKSGYYITLNFYGKTITLLRYGWIDQDDWIPQGSATGQAAVLKSDVYEYKLISINGSYRGASPIQLLNGLGKKTVIEFHDNKIYTFDELYNYMGSNKNILKIKNKFHEELKITLKKSV
jgi:ScaI restriction endonuclease